MLNISENRVDHRVDKSKFRSFSMVPEGRTGRIASRVLLVFLGVTILVLLLPWTQNIRARGYVTSLRPDQRPQTLQSVIAGRIERLYVQEGELVRRGDTIMFISEIKDEYFDPQLLERTEAQIKAKESGVKAYMEKVRALDNQADALNQTQRLKLEQARNYLRQAELKLQSDSIDWEAAKTNYSIAIAQFKRMEELTKQGLYSQTDLEGRRLKMQEAQAKVISAENKVLAAKNGLINAQVELKSLANQYRDKLAKVESEKYAAMSYMYDAEATVTKLQNQYMNYEVRTGMYYITSPIDGYITKGVKTSIGETVKEGEELLTIMPARYDLAVEMYINPVDLPLLHKGQHVRFMFDGWPAIVFSGWPNNSFGTFGGTVVAVDNFISPNGKYRILVGPDPNDRTWPDGLRVGSGAVGMALLQDVPIWYELWRQINGFPPDYYTPETTASSSDKK